MQVVKSLLCSVCALAVTACVSTDLGQRQVGHQIKDKSSVEAAFDFQSEKIEESVRRSGAYISDPLLNAFLASVTREVAGEYAGEIRVYPMEAPFFNAGIFPNGTMLVYSGLMLRAESEAELALVLGHEVGHYVENHSLENHAAASNANIMAKVTTVATGNSLLALMAISEYFSFSRSQELQADAFGLQAVSDVDYDPAESINLWKNLQEEKASSTNKRVRRSNKVSPVFGTHPTSTERLVALREQAGNLRGTKVERETYRNLIRPFLQDWLSAELTNRDYGSLLHLLDRLDRHGEDLGVINYIRAKAYATRDEEGDASKALAAYQAASKASDAPSETWRDLGDFYRNSGDVDNARAAFQTYLTKNPTAEDASLIRYMLDNLEETS